MFNDGMLSKPYSHQILLVDDHPMFRTGVRMVLQEGLAELEITEAASAEIALTMHAPTLLILDIKLHGMSGLESLCIFRQQWPQTTIMILSSQDSAEIRQAAIEGGACALISKAEPVETILQTVRQVLALSNAVISPEDLFPIITESALLTLRQAEVLRLMAQGLPNKTIGKQLFISENTVRGHVQAILSTLKVSSRSEAIFVARKLDMIDTA